MTKVYYATPLLVWALGINLTLAGAQTAAPASASISGKLGLVVFPAKDQTKEQQAADEKACYDWSKQQTGVDPAAVTVNTDSAAAAGKAAADTATHGAAVKGAAGGAAGGAIVGGIAGDAGTVPRSGRQREPSRAGGPRSRPASRRSSRRWPVPRERQPGRSRRSRRG